MARYIFPTQFQLRLGWLSVMAASLGPKLLRLDRDALGAAVFAAATKSEGGEEAQDGWLSVASITDAPQGRISPRAQDEIARMGELYGIYDADAQTLTDLGQILLTVEPWRGNAGDPSPFCWKGAKRFIGLRMVLGANGDMVLALLRRFPASGTLARKDARSAVAGCIEDLLSNATSDEERAELARRAMRVRDVASDARYERYLRVQHVQPQLEPLRELGYIRAADRIGDYSLTQAGQRLRAAMPDVTADVLLTEGLSRLFLAGEGISTGIAARRTDLRNALLALPTNLHADVAEAPLEPVVLLAQNQLLSTSPGSWIDLASAKALVEEVARDSRGAIGLKLATAGGRYNITWTSPEILNDRTLWTSAPSDPSESAPATDDLREGYPNGAQRFAPPPPDASSTPHHPTASNSDQLDEMRVRLLSTLLVRTRPPAGEVHLRLWIRYLSELLDTPAPGGVASTSFGGPRAWLDTLIQYLDHPLLDQRRTSFASLFPEKWPAGNVIALAPLRAWLEIFPKSSIRGAHSPVCSSMGRHACDGRRASRGAHLGGERARRGC